AQGAEEKRKWSAEREELEKRLVRYEARERERERERGDSSVSALTVPSHDAKKGGATSPMTTAVPDATIRGWKERVQSASETSSSQLLETDSMDALRRETTRLRGRLKTLEEALQELRSEGTAVQAVSEVIAGSSGRIRAVVDRVLQP
ncbi:hypothetical protein LTS18_005412, partial [Coniosporium uncinatum]